MCSSIHFAFAFAFQSFLLFSVCDRIYAPCEPVEGYRLETDSGIYGHDLTTSSSTLYTANQVASLCNNAYSGCVAFQYSAIIQTIPEPLYINVTYATKYTNYPILFDGIGNCLYFRNETSPPTPSLPTTPPLTSFNSQVSHNNQLIIGCAIAGAVIVGFCISVIVYLRTSCCLNCCVCTAVVTKY
jgi:hypothetical protein